MEVFLARNLSVYRDRLSCRHRPPLHRFALQSRPQRIQYIHSYASWERELCFRDGRDWAADFSTIRHYLFMGVEE